MKQSIRRATPALAKLVWHQQTRPSTRTVARALTVAGFPIHWTTIRRWKRTGWGEGADSLSHDRPAAPESRLNNETKRPLPYASHERAKLFWQSQKKPSARSVARAMTEAGLSVHFTTVARWRARGWPADYDFHPFDKARSMIDSICPLLTDNAMTTAESLLVGLQPEKAEGLSDAERLRRTQREFLVIGIHMHHLLRPRLGWLLEERLTELPFVIRTLNSCHKAADLAGFQAERLERAQAPAG